MHSLNLLGLGVLSLLQLEEQLPQDELQLALLQVGLDGFPPLHEEDAVHTIQCAVDVLENFLRDVELLILTQLVRLLAEKEELQPQ